MAPDTQCTCSADIYGGEGQKLSESLPGGTREEEAGGNRNFPKTDNSWSHVDLSHSVTTAGLWQRETLETTQPSKCMGSMRMSERN